MERTRTNVDSPCIRQTCSVLCGFDTVRQVVGQAGTENIYIPSILECLLEKTTVISQGVSIADGNVGLW